MWWTVVLTVVVVVLLLVLLVFITGFHRDARFPWLPRFKTLGPSQLMWSRMWETDGIYRGLHSLHFGTPWHLLDYEDQRVLWVRMGSPLPPYISDVHLFVQNILPKRRHKFILVTSDGTRSMPSELEDDGAVEEIVNHPLCEAWFTQNYDGTHSFLRPIPIGLAQHDFFKRHHLPSPRALEEVYLATTIWPDAERIPRIVSDVQFAQHDRHGNPRKVWTAFMGQLGDLVDAPARRIPIRSLWNKYGSYRYVMSLPGVGLDCHRTWEALGLGATVITVSTPLDDLLRPFRVIILDEFEQLLQPAWLDTQWHTIVQHPLPNMQAEFWQNYVVKETDQT